MKMSGIATGGEVIHQHAGDVAHQFAGPDDRAAGNSNSSKLEACCYLAGL